MLMTARMMMATYRFFMYRLSHVEFLWARSLWMHFATGSQATSCWCSFVLQVGCLYGLHTHLLWFWKP